MWPTIAKVLGFVLMLGTGFFYLASGLIVPFPYLPFVWVVWVTLMVVAIVKRDDWRVVLALPFVSTALWFVIINAGDRFLGWTA